MSETKKSPIRPDRRLLWPWALAAGLAVLAAQGWLVARAGTDIPFGDQWDVEGKWLYPAWRDGTLRIGALFHAYNGHRIVWTHLLNLSLFVLNGQWDPVLQMAVGAGLHAFGAGIIVYKVAGGIGRKAQGCLVVGVVLAFLPLAAWHNALWGFQSQVYFALIFSLVAFAWLGEADPTPVRLLAGLGAGLAAMLSMGSGELVPLALLGLAGLRVLEKRRLEGAWRSVWPALVLLAVALALMMSVTPDRELVDFLVLLPLANAWCAIVLVAEAVGRWRTRARVLVVVWCSFLFIGWLGLSLEMWRGIVRPRIRDRLAPVRLAVAFQASGDATVFAGQPRLYVPHPDPESILAVLHDPRLQGALPPSFQPKQSVGPLSCAVRTLMGQ